MSICYVLDHVLILHMPYFIFSQASFEINISSPFYSWEIKLHAPNRKTHKKGIQESNLDMSDSNPIGPFYYTATPIQTQYLWGKGLNNNTILGHTKLNSGGLTYMTLTMPALKGAQAVEWGKIQQVWLRLINATAVITP